ncbi:MAG: outer membrane beta-barrel protein [Pseudomonadota bacterium]
MKKLLFTFLATITVFAYAENSEMNNPSNPSDMSSMMSMSNMMYMDFGLGVGTANNWSGTSMALNVMTMGFYYKPNLGIELGMDMLPNGTYDDNDAMINMFHLAAKGILPVNNTFNVYGKLGLGISAGQGTETSNSMMGGMNMQDMQMIMPVDVGPYYGVGMQFNLSKKFAIYLEDSGVVAVSSTSSTHFGSTNMATMGLEVRM